METIKKHMRKVLLATLTVFMIVQSFPAQAFANEYDFSESLEKAVLETLQVTKVTEELVKETKELDLSNKEITDLTGIHKSRETKSRQQQD